jgi:resuscitation-promoting factor RpfB
MLLIAVAAAARALTRAITIMSGRNSAPAGWYPDPSDSQRVRYWDGRSWSGHFRPASVSAATSGPPESSAFTRAPRPWWQTWLAVVAGLLLCLPLGLIGLWRRQGTSTVVKTAVTAGTVLLLGIGPLASGDPGATPSPIGAETLSDTPIATRFSSPSARPSPSGSPSPSLARVPAVEGLGLVEAKHALRAAGLEVGKVDRRPSSKRKGIVLKQGVGEGRKVKPGSRVPLVVAGLLPRVPSVVGKPEASAVRTLKNAGFKVKTTTRTRTTGQDGVVVSQSPPGGTRAKPKSVVRIVISNVQRKPDDRASRNCTPGYSPCLPPASDYDCAGGTGNGPKYAYGPIRVTGSDPYDLDRDGDGVACES